MVIKLGEVGLDFAYIPDTAAGMVKNGARFFCRYSAGVGGATNPKCTKVGEIKGYTDLGADFLANFEKAESTPVAAADDYAEGKLHGIADKDFWNSRGLHPKAGVIISWEPGNDSTRWNELANFLNGYKTAIGRPVGLYAGLPTLIEMRRRGIIDFTWLPMSSVASGINTSGASNQVEYAAIMEKAAKDNGINLCQNRNRWYGVQADEDIFTTQNTKPFSQLQASAPVPAPTPVPTTKGINEMYMISLPLWGGLSTISVPDPKLGIPVGKKWPGWFFWNGTTLTHVAEDGTKNAAKAAGVPMFIMQRWDQWVEICNSDPAHRYTP